MFTNWSLDAFIPHSVCLYRELSSTSLSSLQLMILASFSSIARLKAATQEAEGVRREQTVWERKVGELQARCTTLEEEKYEALAKVRESVQVAEEAALQKDQVTLSSFLFISQAFFFLNLLSCTLLVPSVHGPLKCRNLLPTGPFKREAEGRRAGEDQRRHQTVNPGCCSTHQKRGEWLPEQEWLSCSHSSLQNI